MGKLGNRPGREVIRRLLKVSNCRSRLKSHTHIDLGRLREEFHLNLGDNTETVQTTLEGEEQI